MGCYVGSILTDEGGLNQSKPLKNIFSLRKEILKKTFDRAIFLQAYYGPVSFQLYGWISPPGYIWGCWERVLRNLKKSQKYQGCCE